MMASSGRGMELCMDLSVDTSNLAPAAPIPLLIVGHVSLSPTAASTQFVIVSAYGFYSHTITTN
jgi:hypothetical protein